MNKIKSVFIVFMVVVVHSTAQAMELERRISERTIISTDLLAEAVREWERINPVVLKKSDGRYHCNKCIFSTTHPNRIEVHYNAHAIMEDNPDITMHSCDDCGYLTAGRRSFKNHLISHEDEKRHRCTIKNCSFKTRRLDSLQRHMKLKHPEIV
jgi:hypothetical protein